LNEQSTYNHKATGHDTKDFGIDQMAEVFEDIYKTNRWRKAQGAGSGSMPENAKIWLRMLFKTINKSKPKIVHDFGCGPYFLYKDFDWPDYVRYTGYDVSDTALERAELNCTNPYAEFCKLENFHDLPGGNLIIVKEVLQHWPHKLRLEFLESLQNKYKWVLVQGSVESTVPPEYKFGLVNYKEYPHETNVNTTVAVWKFNNDTENSLFTS
jgi:hypothetical protein